VFKLIPTVQFWNCGFGLLLGITGGIFLVNYLKFNRLM
jgi:hypothetical protein